MPHLPLAIAATALEAYMGVTSMTIFTPTLNAPEGASASNLTEVAVYAEVVFASTLASTPQPCFEIPLGAWMLSSLSFPW